MCLCLLKLIGTGKHLPDLDKAVCCENVGREANLIFFLVPPPPPMERQKQQTQGEGRGNEEGGF